MKVSGATVSSSEHGQALIEFGVIIVLFVTIALGLMTFGHAFMVANMITHAARDGARVAATWPDRGTCGALLNTATAPSTGPQGIVQKVKDEVETVSGEVFKVTVSQDPPPSSDGSNCGTPTTPTVKVNVQGCVAYIFPILPRVIGTRCTSGQVGFNVDRTVSFYDEGLGGT